MYVLLRYVRCPNVLLTADSLVLRAAVRCTDCCKVRTRYIPGTAAAQSHLYVQVYGYGYKA